MKRGSREDVERSGLVRSALTGGREGVECGVVAARALNAAG